MVGGALRVVLALALISVLVWLYRLGPSASKARDRRPTLSQLAGDGFQVVLVLVLVGLLGALFAIGGNFVPDAPAAPGFADIPEASRSPACGRVRPGLAVVVDVVHSDDKRRWIEQAASAFMRRCPNIQIRLVAHSDFAAADAMLRGELRPTVWAPTDELSLRYLYARWLEQSSELVFDVEDIRSLVESPLVLLLWEDRLRALTPIREAAPIDAGFWLDAMCATIPRSPDVEGLLQEDMLPGDWLDWYQARKPPPPPPPPSRGRVRNAAAAATAPVAPPADPLTPSSEVLRSWGRVKIESPAPTHDAAGLSTLYLMAYQFAMPGDTGEAPGFAPAFARQRDEFRRWLRRCQAGLTEPLETAQQLTDSFSDAGSARHDAIVTYEHLVFPVLEQFDSPELAEPRVLYPQPTLLANHPAVLLWPDDPLRTTELEAAELWLEFLLSEEVQRDAVLFGLRPTALAASLAELDLERNPFLDARRFGIQLDPVVQEPRRVGGRLVRELILLWREATGRS